MAYYYEQLDKAGKAAYYAMYTGLKKLETSIQVPYFEGRKLSDIYFCIRMDHPEIFYTTRFKCRHYLTSDNAEVIPEYLFEKKKIIEHQKAMQARIEKLIRPAENLKEVDQLLYVHDFICKNVHYDKLKKAYSHEIIGPLGQGVGVCEGIAKSVKILLDAIGIWCVIAMCDNNPDKGIKYRHTWNVVKIKDKYYHIDATFDNSLGYPENIRYDYFMICDDQIFRDHERLVYPMPVCTDSEHFYYKSKKLSFTKLEDVRKRAQQAAKKDRTLTFHWRGDYLTKKRLADILTIVEEEGSKKNKYAHVSLNWAQAVMRLRYEEELPEEKMIMEEANEGEKYQEDDM